MVLHSHSAAEEASVSRLVSLLSPKTGEVVRERPRVLTKGQNAIVQLRLQAKLCVELYKDCRPFGRVVLRSGGQTVAVGIVTALM